MTAIDALAAEATAAPVLVEYRGVTYSLPGSSDEMDIEVLEHIESGQIGKALRALLGDEQYARFRVGSKVRDVGEMYALVTKAANLGN